MREGKDIEASFGGCVIVHQNIKSYQKDLHDHDQHEVFFPLKGEIRVTLEATELAAGPGKMLFLPAQVKHSFNSSNQQGERLILLLDPKKYPLKKYGMPKIPQVSPSHQLVKELLFYLLLNPKTKNAQLFVQNMLIVLGECLSENAGSQAATWDSFESRVEDKRIKSALQIIYQNYRDDNSMNELAKKSGMSLRNFNRLFLQQCGKTPKKIILQLRIAEAERLLNKGRHNVTDVAFAVGFNSLTHFIAQFRKLTGRLPSDLL